MLKTFEKIDKFYLLYTGVMLVMAFIAIYTFKTLFQSLVELNILDLPKDIAETRVNQSSLEEAYNFVFNKDAVKMEIK